MNDNLANSLLALRHISKLGVCIFECSCKCTFTSIMELYGYRATGEMRVLVILKKKKKKRYRM